MKISLKFPSIYIPIKEWRPCPESTEYMTITGSADSPLAIEIELNRTYVEAQLLRAALEAAGFDFTMDQAVSQESPDSRQASTFLERG